jgi:hypothetical protein
MKRLRISLGIVVACALSACGGGGDSAPTTPTPSTVLSQTQQLYLDSSLAANGGLYSIATNWITSGPTTTLTAAQVSKSELAQSPAGIPEGVATSSTVGIQLISTFPTPNGVIDTNPNVGTAFIDNGQIYFYSTSSPSKIKFVGNDVVIETAAPGGQIGFKSVVTSFTKVPLTGTLGSAPQDMINFLRPLGTRVNTNATFLPGAAYYQRVSTRQGDHLIVIDGDNNNSTNPQSASPVATGRTIEQFAAAQPTQLTLSLGTIRTVKGARCWVNNASGAASSTSGFTFLPANVPTFRAYCEVGGNIYSASLNPDGTQNGQNYPTGVASTQVNRLMYQPRFNKAAYDSLKAAVP